MQVTEYDVVEVERVAKNMTGCLPGALVGVVFIIASIIWALGGGDLFEDDKEQTATAACNALAARHDGLVLIAAQECDEEEPETTTTTATTEVPAAATGPATVDVPAGAQVFEGTSGGQIGCITCDGQHRYIHITNGTIAVGDAARPGQEIVWPEDGQIVDFTATVSGPNRGRYGFAVFANGSEYRAGCSMEIGQTSCRSEQEPIPVRAGERVTIIVGEGGITNPDGTPASVGDFVVTWQFVFQPD